MGCNPSKSSPVRSFRSTEENGKSKLDVRSPLLTVAPINSRNGPAVKAQRKAPVLAPVAFEIPATTTPKDESIIKAHPPKRLQKLEDQQVDLTHQALREKQVIAEERRQKILQERVQSSRQSAQRIRTRAGRLPEVSRLSPQVGAA